MPRSNVENIVISPFSLAFPASTVITEHNCISMNMSFTLNGGSFNIQVLKDSVQLPVGKDTPISILLQRIGLLKQTGASLTRGGLVDTISGQTIPLLAGQTVNYNTAAYPVIQDPLNPPLISNIIAAISLGAASWQTRDFPVRNFSFGGIALQGIQALAQLLLADVIISGGRVLVVPAGQIIGGQYSVPKTDIINVNQTVDFSREVTALLYPAAFDVTFGGVFIYDEAHAQKQGDTLFQCGAPKGSGAADHIEIPNGWLIEGVAEDWIPPAGTDFTNPASTTSNKYWKTFPSPLGGGMLRGIISFTRLVKDLNLNPGPPGSTIQGNISTFVGTPVTALARSTAGAQILNLQNQFVDPFAGIYGFTAEDTLVEDLVTGQSVSVKNAMELNPPAGSSGLAETNSYAIQLGLWTFPKVLPDLLFQGLLSRPPSTLRVNTVVVTPPGNVVAGTTNQATGVFTSNGYREWYFQQYKQINSRRLVTNISFLYRGVIPAPGQSLYVAALAHPNCGRISSVTLNVTRGGVTVNVTAEVYNFTGG